MSKNLKRVCLVGGCLVGCGLMLAIIGLVFGGSTSISYGNGEWYVPDKENWSSFVTIGSHAGGYDKGESIETGHVSLDAFQELDIDLRAVEVNVIQGEDYGIDLKYRSVNKVTYEVENGVLSVKQERKEQLPINEPDGIVTIYMPQGTQLKSVHMDTGVGDVFIADQIIERLDLRVGMGDVNLESLTIQKLDIQGGMGSIETTDLISYDTKVSVGMGEVAIQGALEGDVTIEGGMGSLSLTTSKPFDDYNYILEKGMGVISINGKEYSILENVREDNGADYTIRINGGMGEIDIHTAE